MNPQLQTWQGEFGDAYTDRNVIDYRSRLPLFRTILNGLPIRSVLEVGCNRGHNLAALRDVVGPGAEITAVEPNAHALECAQAVEGVTAMSGDAYHLPFPDGHFDLVLTSGVLIHIPPESLPKALDELYRCSRRFLLAIEYFAEEDLLIPYRGRDALLWKRNYLKHYQERFPDLALGRTGYVDLDVGFDDCTWWLFEKV